MNAFGPLDSAPGRSETRPDRRYLVGQDPFPVMWSTCNTTGGEPLIFTQAQS